MGSIALLYPNPKEMLQGNSYEQLEDGKPEYTVINSTLLSA
jgi:hypothetical protein